MKQSASIILLTVLMIVAAAISRVIIYPVSFSPLIAMSLFGGAVIKDRRLAFFLPLAAIFLSDVLFEVFKVAPGFYGWGQVINYGLLMLVTLIGFNLKQFNFLNIAAYTVASCLLFYVLSNTSVFFLSGGSYPRNIAGYTECMVAGLPFLRASLISASCYSLLFFSVYALSAKRMAVKQAA